MPGAIVCPGIADGSADVGGAVGTPLAGERWALFGSTMTLTIKPPGPAVSLKRTVFPVRVAVRSTRDIDEE
jgi:hypothetical protein